MCTTVVICFICACVAFLVCAVGFTIDSISNYLAEKEARELNKRLFDEGDVYNDSNK